ncbi:MAG: DUF882 domain-containing protein [Polyangia bacterium]
MVPWLGLFVGTLLPVAPATAPVAPPEPAVEAFPAEALVPVNDERAEHLPSPLRERSKKELWLADKAHRPDVHVTDEQLRPPRTCRTGKRPPARQPCAQAAEMLAGPMPPIGTRVQPLATLHNQWTRELMSFIPGQPYLERFRIFLRDHFTNQATNVDPELADVLVSAALHFHAQRIDVVSGYRSPKYNLMLRKKGHQVARESQHTQGNAVDFRIRGVPTEKLLGFVRSLRLGGVGFYPHAHFVHSDTGPIRYWQGS